MGVYLPFMGSFWVGDGWGGSGSSYFISFLPTVALRFLWEI